MGQSKRCPLCQGTIPPSRDEISNIKLAKKIMNDTAHPAHLRCYDEYAELVKQFEAKYGEDWESTMIEYSSDLVGLPRYVAVATGEGNVRTVLLWLGKGDIKERVNAKCHEVGNSSLLWAAATDNRHDLMSYLLLNGADVNILTSTGASVLQLVVCSDQRNHSQAARLLLSWGAELFENGKQMTEERKLEWRNYVFGTENAAIAKLMSSELGGRRCEIISTPNTRSDLVGKTCVVEEYVMKSNQYKVTMEFTNEVLLLGMENLKRRDRTPQDPVYYVECKNIRLIRRDFKSNEECQAFIADLGADEEELTEVDPEKEAKAEQAAADLLAELGLEDLDGLSSSASKKEKQPVSAGKKKKRGGKKKGRK